jgi:hypothetical protein
MIVNLLAVRIINGNVRGQKLYNIGYVKNHSSSQGLIMVVNGMNIYATLLVSPKYFQLYYRSR